MIAPGYPPVPTPYSRARCPEEYFLILLELTPNQKFRLKQIAVWLAATVGGVTFGYALGWYLIGPIFYPKGG